MQNNELKEATRIYEEGIEYLEENTGRGINRAKGKIYMGLATLYKKMNLPEKAEEYTAKARELYNQKFPKIIKETKWKNPAIGLEVSIIDNKLIQQYGLNKKTGVVITKVIENTPAYRFGLKEGQVIESVDGEKITSISDLKNEIDPEFLEDGIKLIVNNKGDKNIVTLLK